MYTQKEETEMILIYGELGRNSVRATIIICRKIS